MRTAVPDHVVVGVESIRVATVPSSHVYVRHLAPAEGSDPSIVRLADPHPDDPTRSAVERWWPPVMLDPEWVRAHADEFEVFHLQFGFDARTVEQLTELVEALRENGKPFVYTVHDLRNPHHASREAHDAQLDVLIPAADALITLTPGAAAEILDRWGRTATVLPHPHVVDAPTMERIRAERAERAQYAELSSTQSAEPSHAQTAGGPAVFRIGVHVKSLRASVDPLPAIQALVRGAESLPGAVIQVDGHTDVFDTAGPRHDPELAAYLLAASERGDIELHVHDFFTDDELWRYLASLDVSVLPYRFGTHSGWLEACRDLGTDVIAPDCGYYAEQGPVHSYHRGDDGLDAESLIRALHEAAHHVGESHAASIAGRMSQREHIAAAHLELYRALLAGRA
ncbi:glycosyltransferase family 1 protein [Herbiconiux sp. P15]|uniref:glycosyltransferase family 1 protein n=1 Tax=Herbiconiux liukaitaii TaxID=3342799 RepID=UPI0035B9DE60